MVITLQFWFNEFELMIVSELPEIQCTCIIIIM